MVQIFFVLELKHERNIRQIIIFSRALVFCNRGKTRDQKKVRFLLIIFQIHEILLWNFPELTKKWDFRLFSEFYFKFCNEYQEFFTNLIWNRVSQIRPEYVGSHSSRWLVCHFHRILKNRNRKILWRITGQPKAEFRV